MLPTAQQLEPELEPYMDEAMESPEFQMMEPAYDQYSNIVPFDPLLIEMDRNRRQLQQRIAKLSYLSTQPNVAELLKDEELARIGALVVREYNIDKDSRRDWETTARKAMDMAKQKKETRTTPWEGASNVKYPLLTIAALQFAARAYPAIVDGKRVVKTMVMGRDEGGVKAGKADRVSQHMSYQLLSELDNWESDVDTMLHQIPVIGCAFKKIYENSLSQPGFSDELVSAFDLVVNQSAKSLETVPRISHFFTLYPHEIEERQRAGDYLDVELHSTQGEDDEDAPQTFIEQHRYLDLDQDKTVEPWIVTVHLDTQKVVRIKPCFDMEKIETNESKGLIVKIHRKRYFVKVPFIPDPEGGFYDIGFGKLLEATCDVIDTAINQMMDAGTLQNAGGGFISGSVKFKKSNVKLRPGEYQSVQANGQDLRQSIVNMDHPGPAPVLMSLLEMMIESGKDIAAVKDVLTGETPSNQTATSTMAAIEQGLKVFTAIYKRIFRALQAEFRVIYKINQSTLNVPKYVALLDQPVEVTQQDYSDDMDVMPVADPNSTTDMQRLAKAQFLMEQVQAGNPHIDAFAVTRRSLEAARIDDIEELLVPPGPKPQDAIMEAGAKAEVAKTEAQAVQAHAAAEKSRVDALVALATTGLPPAMVPQVFPMPFGDYQPPPGAEPPAAPPMDQMGMDGGGIDPNIPPGMMDPSPGMGPDDGYTPDMPMDDGSYGMTLQ